MSKVFVYGTLKRGGSNHHYLAGQRFLGDARTQPQFRLYELNGYPGMVSVTANGLSIQGEVWEVDEACLQRLDDLEGVDSGLYQRVPLPLLAPYDATIVDGYLYLQGVLGRTDLGESYSLGS